jgi:hypothetical protein
MIRNGQVPGRLRQRAHEFFLSGSYWFGVVALLLQLAAYGGYGREKVTSRVRDTVSYYWEKIRAPDKVHGWLEAEDESPLVFVLKHTNWRLPEQLVFGAVGTAALGAALALVAFTLRWKKPIPSALALLLNVVPALLSLGLIYQARP